MSVPPLRQGSKPYNKQGYVLQYPNGSLAGIDISSGGYPYPADDISRVWASSREEMEKYIRAGNPEKLQIRAIKIQVEITDDLTATKDTQ